MKYAFSLFALVFAATAFAGEVQELQPFSKTLLIPNSDRPTNIWIYSARKTAIATKVEFVEGQCRVSDSDICSERKVLETAPGFEITVGYEIFVGRASDSDNQIRTKLYVRESDAPAAVAATAKNSFLRARDANRLFGLTIGSVTRTEQTIDQQRSRLCDSDALRCEDEIVYKDIQVQYTTVAPAVK